MFGIVNRITGRVTTRLEDQTTTLQTMRGAGNEMSTEGRSSCGDTTRKEEEGFSVEDEETDTADLGIRGQENHKVYGKCGELMDLLVTSSGVSSVGKEGM